MSKVLAFMVIGMLLGLGAAYFISTGTISMTALDTAYFISQGYDMPTQADYYVSTSGSDSNSGTTEATAFATIQHALNVAQPGDFIKILPGRYAENIITTKGGTKGSPITLYGDSSAVLTGAVQNRLFEINHNYITLHGFTIDGFMNPSAPDVTESYMDKLIYMQGKGTQSGIEGVRIIKMTIKNAGGECIRMRYFNQNNEVAYNTINDCGINDFRFNGGGKNGEAVYVGTSTTQWADGKNPTADPDETSNNWIHHNTIQTNGNECVDMKEGGENNIIEFNTCIGGLDVDSGAINVRSDNNIIRSNEIYGSLGAGIRLGGYVVNSYQYGVNNDVYENNIHDNALGGIKIMVAQQGQICGNIMSNNVGGNTVGTYASLYNPTAACTEPPPEEITPNPPTGVNEPGFRVIPVLSVTASSFDNRATSYSPPASSIDNDLNTKWAAQGAGEYIVYDLGDSQLVSFVKLAFQDGTSRVQYFSVAVSNDAITYTDVYSGQSSGGTIQLQKFDFADINARYVKITGNLNTVNDWNSITEARIYTPISQPIPDPEPEPEPEPELTGWEKFLQFWRPIAVYVYGALAGLLLGFAVGKLSEKPQKTSKKRKKKK